MRTTLLMSIGLAIFLATSVGTASALDDPEIVIIDLPGVSIDDELIVFETPIGPVKTPGSGECNGVVDTNCECPSGYGSATCRDGEDCRVYFWAVWPECLLG